MAYIFHTDDPTRDWDRKCEEEDEWLSRRPVCDICGEHIQDDYYYNIDGIKYCPLCMKDNEYSIDDV
jgi:hypothetical protein